MTNQSMTTPPAGMQTFSSAYPFHFKIENQFQHQAASVLYIVDHTDEADLAQQIHLLISNSDDRMYVLQGFGSSYTGVSETLYNLAILFRPGTLNSNVEENFGNELETALTTALNTTVRVAGPLTRLSDGALAWYCAFQEDVRLEASSKLSLELCGISAESGTGSRSTQVELSLANLLIGGSGNPLSFTRSTHLDIINHQGSTYAPMYFGVLGHNTLLNDTPDQELTLYFETLGRQPLDFGPDTEIEFAFHSSAADPNLMYFGGPDEVDTYTLTPGESIPMGVDGIKRITASGLSDLKEVVSLTFSFSNIQLSGPDGTVMVLVTIRCLPGYWDTEYQVPILKEITTTRAEIEIGRTDSRGHTPIDEEKQKYGSRIDFLSGGSDPTDEKMANVSIEESSGLHLYGTSNQPVTVHTDLHVDLNVNIGKSLTVNGTATVDGLIRSVSSGSTDAGMEMVDESNVTRGVISVANGPGQFSHDAVGGDVIVRADTGKLLLQSGVGSSAIAISTDNNVGIGTAPTTSNKLEVGGAANIKDALAVGGNVNIGGMTDTVSNGPPKLTVVANVTKETIKTVRAFAVTTNDRSNPFALDIRLVGASELANRAVYIQSTDFNLSDGGNILLQPDGGNVGIGRIPTASNKLEVGGAANVTGALTVGADIKIGAAREIFFSDNGQIRSSDDNHRILFRRSENTLELREYGQIVFSPGAKSGEATSQVVMLANGNVGIGTNNPATAKLVISGGVSGGTNVGSEITRQFNHNIDDTDRSDTFSLRCSNAVEAAAIYVVSDARIKHIQGHSDGAADLATLGRIEITDYTLKGVSAHGNVPLKKVIGQQVESVYPQAVSRSTEVVPDIYQKANVKDGWIKLVTNLVKGERVRLIGEKKEGIHEVLEVAQDSFRTDFEADSDAVFVYGREVNDFLSVDYDAIAMLNVSATQQLKKEKDAEVKALQAEIADLQAGLAVHEKRVSELEARNRQFEVLHARLPEIVRAEAD